MGETIKKFFDLLFDNSKSWTFRTAAVISIIGLLVLTDLILNFTYNLHTNSKLAQLEKIQVIREGYQSDSLKFEKILQIENKILNKEHYTEILYRNFSNIIISSSQTKDKNRDDESNNHPTQSLFWMAFSSNYVIAVILPFLILLPIYSKETRTGTGILGWFASLTIFGAVIILFTWLSYLVPIVWNNPIYNYILNALIHTVLWILIAKLGKR